ncbi:MAG TPA: DNA polymerase III subunit delta, partial [Marinilabiliaceae bacterium]|nr:DNA polymerase III subunit delta [Marinilabiliaceae bacterium]
VASALKMAPYHVDDLQVAARNYTGLKVAEIISLLREYDVKSKGFGSANTSDGELLKEMIFKILH